MDPKSPLQLTVIYGQRQLVAHTLPPTSATVCPTTYEFWRLQNGLLPATTKRPYGSYASNARHRVEGRRLYACVPVRWKSDPVGPSRPPGWATSELRQKGRNYSLSTEIGTSFMTWPNAYSARTRRNWHLLLCTHMARIGTGDSKAMWYIFTEQRYGYCRAPNQIVSTLDKHACDYWESWADLDDELTYYLTTIVPITKGRPQ